MKKKVMAQLFRVLPQKTISSFIGKLAKSTISRGFVPIYAKLYRISTDEMEKPLHEYTSLTAFFTRKLKEKARIIDANNDTVISPVDGTISSLGTIQHQTMIQAKGISYSLTQLLGDEEKAKIYENGSYLTIYLSPRDYHRIHVPLDGYATESTYIPGKLYPVNTIGVSGVEGLFTKNERMITYMDTNEGEIALVKVGAFIVGSVQVNYPLSTIQRKGKELEYERFEQPLLYKKGEEIGFFAFGSTVILLFEQDKFSLKEELKENQTVKMGESLGYRKT